MQGPNNEAAVNIGSHAVSDRRVVSGADLERMCVSGLTAAVWKLLGFHQQPFGPEHVVFAGCGLIAETGGEARSQP